MIKFDERGMNHISRYRCPGCGRFEGVVLVDHTVNVGNVVKTESSPLRYCGKCRGEFLETIRPPAGRSPGTPTAGGILSTGGK